jgi:hypothetical protein
MLYLTTSTLKTSPMYPMSLDKVGMVIERKLLIDLLLEAARECNMAWWDATREISAVVFGVMRACVIYRHLVAEKQDDAELSDIRGQIDLSADEVDEVKQLAESREEGLSL